MADNKSQKILYNPSKWFFGFRFEPENMCLDNHTVECDQGSTQSRVPSQIFGLHLSAAKYMYNFAIALLYLSQNKRIITSSGQNDISVSVAK